LGAEGRVVGGEAHARDERAAENAGHLLGFQFAAGGRGGEAGKVEGGQFDAVQAERFRLGDERQVGFGKAGRPEQGVYSDLHSMNSSASGCPGP
jgi:hypothetical protein